MRLARVLPGVAIGFVAVVILGPGNARPVLGARLYVAPWENDRIPSARIATIWRLGQAERPAPDVDVGVEIGGRVIEAKSGADGIADVSIAAPPLAPVAVRAGDAVLAEGSLDLRSAPPVDWSPPDPSRSRGILVALEPVRGQLAPPFPDEVAVVVGDGAQRGKKAHAVIELTGASPAKVELDLETLGQPSTFEVTPEALRVDYEARAEAEDGAKGTIGGSLHTVPGAMWIDPKSPPDRLDIVAPAPRRVAYVSFWTERGRIGGATVPLHEDEKAFHRGSVPRPTLGEDASLDVVVSGDPEELGAATVTWPVVRGPKGSRVPWRSGDVVPRLRRIVDGVPAAWAVEEARVRRVRSIAIGVALLVGLLEIILLVREGRRAQRDLDAHFAAQADAADDAAAGAAIREVAKSAAKSGSVMVTILGAMIALAFGIVAAFVVAR